MRDVAKSFGAVIANRNATLDVAQGEIHALVGENGAGKSTLMRVFTSMKCWCTIPTPAAMASVVFQPVTLRPFTSIVPPSGA